jgi:hypothetical protein
MRTLIAGLVTAFCAIAPAGAGEADILDVETHHLGGETWRFDVTLAHADTGWDHYADLWIVTDAAGNRLGERVLAHPHVDEQPFTRSARITVPEGTRTVIVKARDSVHGFGGKPCTITLAK